MARVAVVGAGAIGTTIAAWLVHAGGHDVQLCVRSPVVDLEVDSPKGVISAAPTVRTTPDALGPVDWVLVTTKTYDTASVAPWLSQSGRAEFNIAILQNGVEHRRHLEGIVSPDRSVPVIVDIPAERTGPGRVRQHRMGSMIVPAGANGREFRELMADLPIDVSTTSDFLTAAWRKLAVNCAGAVNALALKPASITRMEAVATAMRGLIRECIAVGRAEGALLADDLVEEVIAGYLAGPPDGVNSIHADRIAGRRMEWDARNGVIVRLGARNRIETPLNQMAAALLAAAER